MATLQKFKLLATQCSVLGSPTRSPTTSPVIHIRRRKTLRMLLGGKGNGGVFNRRFIHHQPPPTRRVSNDLESSKLAEQKTGTGGRESSIGARLKLKDLFVSSPPPTKGSDEVEVEEKRLLPEEVSDCSGTDGGSGGSLVMLRRGGGGGGNVRPFSATLRQRLLMRRAWRPVLVAIPEQSP